MHRADLIRYQLMRQHGGMWIDADTYFVQPLNWTQHLRASTLLHNKIGDFPEVILGAQTPNKATVDDSDLKMTVNLFPGLSHWFILAQPHSQLFEDVFSTVRETLKKGMQAMSSKLVKEKIHLDDQFIE